jgi:hypothetical protein
MSVRQVARGEVGTQVTITLRPRPAAMTCRTRHAHEGYRLDGLPVGYAVSAYDDILFVEKAKVTALHSFDSGGSVSRIDETPEMRPEQTNITRRITDSFVNKDEEQVTKYLDWLYSRITDYSQSMRRTSLLVLLLIAIFELVNGPGAVQVSLGSFRISKGSIILIFIPALVAYLYLQVWIDTMKGEDLEKVFQTAFGCWWQTGKENNLHEFIVPPTPLFLECELSAAESATR